MLVGMLVGALVVLGGSCTGKPARSPTTTSTVQPSPGLQGRVLVGVDQPQHGLAAYSVRTGTLTQFRLPQMKPLADGSLLGVLGAWWDPASDAAYALLQMGARSQLYRLALDAAPRAVGPPVGFLGLPVMAGGSALVQQSTCNTGAEPVVVLDLGRPSRWRQIAKGCPATLSPDGRWAAYAPDGTSIWRASTNGSRPPARVVELAAIGGLRAAGLTHPRIEPISGISWGGAGMAFVVASGRRYAVVVRTAAGANRVLPLAAAEAGIDLAWQPGGGLLAISDFDVTGDQAAQVLRFYNPSSGSLARVGAAPPHGFEGLVWAPDGHALVVRHSSSFTPEVTELELISAKGQELHHADVKAYPYDWRL